MLGAQGRRQGANSRRFAGLFDAWRRSRIRIIDAKPLPFEPASFSIREPHPRPMENALAATPMTTLVPAQGVGARLAAMPARSKLGLVVGLAALIAVVLAMTVWSTQGDYKVLFANLADKDAGAVTAQLTQMNVPYRIADGGGAI